VFTVLAGAYVAYTWWATYSRLPEGLIQANGRMEGDRLMIASKFPGRVQALLVHEGATVAAGQVMARLDDA